jgi:PadR family transcriptional regulator
MEGEMLKGHLDMIVLAALAAGPAHGYAVIEEIRRKSGQAFDLPEGTIYPALHRLEQAGLLSSRWVVAESGRQRRVYTLTRRGERALTKQRGVWRQFCEAMGGLLTSTPRRGRPA